MSFKPNSFAWGALVGGFFLHVTIELAQAVSRRLVKVDPTIIFSVEAGNERKWNEEQRKHLPPRDIVCV